MKLGFFIDRNPYYKILAPVIDEALRRGHDVTCFLDYSQPKTRMKGYQFPSIDTVPTFLYGTPQLITYQNNDNLNSKTKDIEAIVTTSLPFLSSQKKRINKKIPIVSFQHATDSLYHTHLLPEADLYFYYSPIWFDWAVDFLGLQKNLSQESVSKFRSKTESKVRFVGFTELDQMNIINSHKVREDWNIPQESPIVLFLPFPFKAKTDNFWVPYIYGMHNPTLQFPLALFSGRRYRYTNQILNGENDYNLCRAIRKFCDRNEAYLIVKSRKKHPVRGYLSKLADKVIYDDSYYPADILKCLSISGLCINFLSTTVTEAISVEVPNVAISPDPSDYTRLQDIAWKFMREKAWDFFDFDGASQVWTIENIINELPKRLVEDFAMDPKAKEKYIEKFVGYSDEKSSSRMIDEIEKSF